MPVQTEKIRRGTYLLFLNFNGDTELEIGSLGAVKICAGSYCYVGSAMGGLDQRLKRHLTREKKIRWHIDRLTIAADSVEAYESYPDFIPECDLARHVVEHGGVPSVKGFGCSDCRCETHLFRVDQDVAKDIVLSLRLKLFRPDGDF